MIDYPNIEELRRWSAELLPDQVSISCSGIMKLKDPTKSYRSWQDWCPDNPEAPAKQILMVVEKMREKGLYLELRNYDVDDEYRACFYTEETIFYENGVGRACEKSPCLAILKATWAAWRTRGNNQ